MQAESRIWDKDAVQALIATNDKALSRALWHIYQRQTAAEQSALQTIEHNGRGRSRSAAATRTILILGNGTAVFIQARIRANTRAALRAPFDQARADFEAAWTGFLS